MTVTTLCASSVATMTNNVAVAIRGVFIDEEEEKESIMEGRKSQPMTCESPLSHKQCNGRGHAWMIGSEM